MIDARGIPTCECPSCGNTLFRALVSFDPKTYMVDMYHLDMQCNDCGAFCTAPTPIDHPENPSKDHGTKE
jgi:uncharacterized Zn finger protein